MYLISCIKNYKPWKISQPEVCSVNFEINMSFSTFCFVQERLHGRVPHWALRSAVPLYSPVRLSGRGGTILSYISYCCCPNCSMLWTVLCSEGPRCCGTAVIPERLGDDDPTWPWDGEATRVCASVRVSGDPTLAEVWYWGVGPLGLAVCREVTDPIRRTAAGEAGLWAEYGDAARWTGNVVEEYALGFSGRESVTDGEPNPVPREVLSDPLEGDTPVLIT